MAEDDDKPGMTDDEIKGLLVREITSARSNDDSSEAKNRRKAIDYYNGDIKEDLPAEEGRSSVVSHDLSDTVGWVLPQIIRVLTATDQIVIVEAVGSEDEALAQEMTDGLNHVFYKDNQGYRILRDATWNALVVKNGVVKVWHDDKPEYATSFHSGLSDEEVALFEADPAVEITHQTTTSLEIEIGVDPASGLPQTATLNEHEVKVKRLKSNGRRRIECIPTEDYLRSDDPPGTERPRFEGHRSYKTRSELIEMGFDREIVDKLGAATDNSPEQQARNRGYSPQRDVADASMETIEVVEGYLQVDVDDDGIAETVRSWYAGDTSGGVLLGWEVWEDEGPFFTVPCEPLPHDPDGRSLADDTMDMMRVKSVLWRQALDNTYAANNPQRFVVGEVLNPDELFSPTFGGAIYGRAGTTVSNLTVPFVANAAYDALGYADEIISRRTGVSRQSMALDAEALVNQSATASNNNKDASYTQVEQIVRDMAELGWKPIFRALLKLEIKHQDRPRQIRMGKRAVTIDPRHWNADMDVTVNVGQGTGSRDRDLVRLGQVLQSQLMLADRFMSAGAIDDAIDMLPKIIDTLTKMGESAGLRDPSAYYPEYTVEKVAALKKAAAERASKPDPKVAAEAEKAALDAQAKEAQAQRDHEYRMAQTNAQLTLNQQSAKYQHDEKVRQINGDLALKRDQLAAELDLKRELGYAQMGLNAELKSAGVPAGGVNSTSDVHLGGEPG